MIFAILLNLVVLAAATATSWWLSGYDSRLTGQHERIDFIRRSLRCGFTLFLVEAGFWCLWFSWRNHDPVAGVAYLAVIPPLALIWAGCISGLFAHIFTAMVDPEDKREFDPKQGVRELDGIANLIRMGKKDEAIRLCRVLIESGEANIPALEMTLAHLGVPPPGIKIFKPLAEASALRRQGKFGEAEVLLSSLLLKDPRDLDAAMMLVRLYAQEMRQPNKAEEVLQALEKQPHISAGHIEFARRSISEWSRPVVQETEPVAPPQSVEELLTQRSFGTAIEVLEKQIQEQPQDFDLRLKLAEIQAVHCANFLRAEKIIRQMESDPGFSPEQVQLAWTRLKIWREPRKGVK